MNKARIQLLIQELRKPHYKHIRGLIGNPTTCHLCATGVAMKLFEEQTNTVIAKNINGFYKGCTTPISVRQWYDIPGFIFSEMSYINDEHNATFEEQALYLEDYLNEQD